MPNKIFQDIVKNDINNLIRESEAINDVQHSGLKGNIREFGIGKLLLKYLPHDYAIGSGQVQDSNGKQSNESDLIIYNKHILPPIMFGEQTGFFPIESCNYVIEVKTTSNATEIKSTIVKFNNLKSLYSLSGNIPVRAYLAYSTDLSNDNEFERYIKYDPEFLTNPAINVICVVGHGYWYFQHSFFPDGSIFGVWNFIKAEINYEFGYLISGIVNTLSLFKNNPAFGYYLLENVKNGEILYSTKIR